MAWSSDRDPVKAVLAEVLALGEPGRAKSARAFFKTGPGEYAEGDIFLGCRVPDLRKLARTRVELPLPALGTLLASPVHENRLFALLVLVLQNERSGAAGRRERFEFYLKHLDRVNNWDLVDLSAAPIAGEHVLASGDELILPRLARSTVLWERRVAIVATHAAIRAGDPRSALSIAEMLLADDHDLIHKAVGWMLREVGKRVSVEVLRGFLQGHADRMPRTALRYAIERLEEGERARWLKARDGRLPKREAAPR